MWPSPQQEFIARLQVQQGTVNKSRMPACVLKHARSDPAQSVITRAARECSVLPDAPKGKETRDKAIGRELQSPRRGPGAGRQPDHGAAVCSAKTKAKGLSVSAGQRGTRGHGTGTPALAPLSAALWPVRPPLRSGKHLRSRALVHSVIGGTQYRTAAPSEGNGPERRGSGHWRRALPGKERSRRPRAVVPGHGLAPSEEAEG